MKKTLLITGLLFLFIAGIIIYTKKEDVKHEAEITPKSIPVIYVAAEGKVETAPGFEVEVGSEVDGRIAEFFVEEGDTVKKDGPIARIENKDILARLREAVAELDVARAKFEEVASGAREEEIKMATAILERAIADRELAEKELERYRELFQDSLVSRSTLDAKETAFRSADAKVREAEEGKTLLEKGPRAETLKLHEDSVKRAEAAAEYYSRLLDKTLIIAPISGKVIRKYLQSGEIISKEMLMSLVAIADLERVRINAEVDETDVGRVKVGYPVEITSVAYPGKVFKGSVTEISDYAGARKVRPNNPVKNLDMKVVQVKIDLKETAPFKLGMTVDVRIMPNQS